MISKFENEQISTDMRITRLWESVQPLQPLLSPPLSCSTPEHYRPLSPTKSLHQYFPFPKLIFSSRAFTRSPAWRVNLSLISSIYIRYLTFSFLARKPSSSFGCQILASIFNVISNQSKIPNLRNSASQIFRSSLVSMYTAPSVASITSLNTFSDANAANARHG